uniref:Importin N-terminal domain-containing protein n=1 Tax=Globodera pallida TaxID=36090 RepID=A0A183BVD7_GLOPA
MELDFLRQAQFQLLDNNEKFNVESLDKVVTLMNRSTGEAQKAASDILARFKESSDSWTKVDTILEFSDLLETKYFGLQIWNIWFKLVGRLCRGISVKDTKGTLST